MAGFRDDFERTAPTLGENWLHPENFRTDGHAALIGLPRDEGDALWAVPIDRSTYVIHADIWVPAPAGPKLGILVKADPSMGTRDLPPYISTFKTAIRVIVLYGLAKPGGYDGLLVIHGIYGGSLYDNVSGSFVGTEAIDLRVCVTPTNVIAFVNGSEIANYDLYRLGPDKFPCSYAGMYIYDSPEPVGVPHPTGGKFNLWGIPSRRRHPVIRTEKSGVVHPSASWTPGEGVPISELDDGRVQLDASAGAIWSDLGDGMLLIGYEAPATPSGTPAPG